MKYLRIKPFKELRAADIESESDSDKIEIIQTKVSGSKRTSNDDCIALDAGVGDSTKKLKLESALARPRTPGPASTSGGGGRETKLSSVQVLGHELLYKQHAAAVMFKKSSVMELLMDKMPFEQQSPQLESVIDNSRSNGDENKKAFISWSKIKMVLNGGLLDLSIREAMIKHGGRTFAPNDDLILLNAEKVKFKVKNGMVYLEVLSAFTSLGRLHEALTCTWTRVDSILAEAGLSLKAAFKRKAIGDSSNSSSHAVSRNYITLQAFSLVSHDNNKVKSAIDNLIGIVDTIKGQQNKICTEIQQTVNMILRMSCIVPADSSQEEDSSSGSGSQQLEQKYCDNSQCGRGYHYVSRCCSKVHSFNICDQEIGYVRRHGKVFLEKCSAFALIGRLYVIRCSDYKKVDNILLQNSNKKCVNDYFLFEREGFVRNLRTHISLDGFVTLLEAGFDVSGHEDLLKSVLELRNTYQTLRRESCEDFETIDLSSSEGDTETEAEKKGCSSGLESEDLSPTTARRRLNSFHDYDSDDDSNIESGQANQITDFVEMLGVQIPVQIFNEKIYVDRGALLKVASQQLQYGIKNIDKILCDDLASEDGDYLMYQGRQKVFLSVLALQKLLASEKLDSFDFKDGLVQDIFNILRNFNGEKSQILSLPSFEDIKYKLVNGIVYLDAQKVLKLAGFTSAYFLQPPAKANLFLCRVLAERGVNTHHCFCKHGKSKYAFISIAATSVLLRSDIGHLKDNDKSFQLIEEIMEALNTQNILRKSSDKQEMCIKVLDEYPAIKYKILDGKLFLHRKSSFECLELEASVLSSRRGYTALNTILRHHGLELDSCYLASRQQRYCYISVVALAALLQSQEPLIVCLPNKDRFLAGLLGVLQQAAIATLGLQREPGPGTRTLELDNEEAIEMKAEDGSVYLDMETAFKISGLQDQASLMEDPRSVLEERGLDPARAYLARGGDTCGWVSLHCLYLLMTATIAELSTSKVAWRDILSAVALYQPRMKAKLRIETVKTKMIEKFESFFVEHSSVLAESGGTEMESPAGEVAPVLDRLQLSLPLTNRNLRVSGDQRVPGSCSDPGSPQPPSTLHSPALPPAPAQPEDTEQSHPKECSLTAARFMRLREDILAQADSVGPDEADLAIGDWRLETLEEELLRLSVRSGYGASRKNSFLHPDFAAILRYSLVLTPMSVSLTVNEKAVDTAVIKMILDKTETEGTLSFLVQLISLRPCFGSFSPELVETVSQALERDAVPDNLRDVFIDNNFIGTSSCGRTYAGTVRHRACRVLAVDRVSDVCAECRQLGGLTINRSVLAQAPAPPSCGEQEGQKSVWQLATTSADSCSFVCPQVQTFNTSLPHAFDGRAQASTIVSHRVDISNNLNVEVRLGDKKICKTFPEFQESRQLGPLLDWVAGLRLCVGYPNLQLVRQAADILQHADRLGPDTKKLFRNLHVDPGLEIKMAGDGSTAAGTIRSVHCSSLAETSADICSQCRTLQEPVEFVT